MRRLEIFLKVNKWVDWNKRGARNFFRDCGFRENNMLYAGFNACRLKTVALTFTEINFSQCSIKLWTSGSKGLKCSGRAYLYH